MRVPPQRLDSFWTSPAPVAATAPSPAGAGRPAAPIGAFAWPAAVLLIVHRLVALVPTGSVTDDFTTVWSAARRFVERVPVYNEVYHHVDPHYLYNPGATLLLSPLGLVPTTEAARPLFVTINALAIIAAIAWLTRLAGFRLSQPVLPVALALAFTTEAVTNTLVFGNINGVLLLALTGFIALTLSGRQLAAGVVLGLAIVVKPMFAPLIILPLMRLRWATVLTAVAVPAALNAVAWPLTPGADAYLTDVVPYLSTTRDYANSSLAGLAIYFGMPGWLHAAAFCVLAVAVAVAIIGLARWRYSDEWLWLTISCAVLITGVCLLSSLGQAYYSMMIFPALATAAHRASPMHTWPAWLGAILCLSPLDWGSPQRLLAGSWLHTFLPTAGWALFVVATATWVAWVISRQIHRPNSQQEGLSYESTE